MTEDSAELHSGPNPSELVALTSNAIMDMVICLLKLDNPKLGSNERKRVTRRGIAMAKAFIAHQGTLAGQGLIMDPAPRPEITAQQQFADLIQAIRDDLGVTL